MKANIQNLLSSMPERVRTKAEAESRAEYLRIGTFSKSYVIEQDGKFVVIKVK